MTDLPTIMLDLRQHSNSVYFNSVRGLKFLLDSGTNRSLVTAAAVQNTNLVQAELATPRFISSAFQNSTKPIIFNEISTNIYFPDSDKEIPDRKLLVVNADLQYDGILGMDCLTDRTISFDEDSQPTIVNKINVKSQQKDDFVFVNALESTSTQMDASDQIAAVVLAKTTTLLPTSTCYAECHTEWQHDAFTPEKLFLVATEPVLQANCGVREEHNAQRNLIKIFNNSMQTVVFPEKLCLAKGFLKSKHILSSKDMQNISNYLLTREEATEADRKVLDIEAKEWQKKRLSLIRSIPLDDEIDKIVAAVPPSYAAGLKSSLKKYNSVFARHNNDSGLNPSFLVDLQLKDKNDTNPLYVRPYRLDPQIAEQLDAKCGELQNAGILEECSSPWNTPCLAIRKKDKSLRLVNNFSCGLNQRLTCSTFPIPPIRTLNRQISDAMTEFKKKYPGEKIFLSQLDVKNGFYVLSLANSARDKTAFIVSKRQMRYARLSMGLSLSPSVFQRFLHRLFFDRPFEVDGCELINYLDDFLIISPESVHQKALDKFFEMCSDNRILLSLAKCHFFRTRVEFLGLEVDASGFRAKPSKLDALLRMSYPTTKKEAMRLMGSYNFFGRMVPRVTACLAPFAAAVAKKDFVLTDAMKKSLDQLKSFVKLGGVTAHLDYSNTDGNTVFLACDTSLTQTGFCLGNATLDEDDSIKIKHVSHYGSKKLDEVVMLLSARSRELIGLSLALESFHDLIPTTLSFVALVDHKSLTSIKTARSLGKTSANTRARNALAKCLNFSNMRIMYCPGDNAILQVADGLSRSQSIQLEEVDAKIFDPKLELPANLIDSNYMETIDVSARKLKEEQAKDPALKKIIENMGTKQCANVGKKDYFMTDGLLQAQVSSGATLTVIPESMAKTVVELLHVQTLHSGERRLFQAIRRSNILIPGKTKLVQDVCRTCILCQLQQTTKFKKEQNIDVPIQPGLRPWMRVAIDLMDISYSNSTVYFLSFVCKFTHYLDFEIVTRKSADAIVPALVGLIARNGGSMESEIASDQGKEFLSGALQAAYTALGVVGHAQTAYNSRANPCERTHKELRRLMKTLMATTEDFRFKIKLSAYFYNDQPQRGLGGRTPREMLTGVPPRQLLQFLRPEDRTQKDEFEEPAEESFCKWTEYLNMLHCAHGLSEVQRLNAIKLPKSTFKINDIVLILDPVLTLSKSKAAQAKGPYIVTAVSKQTLSLRHCITHHKTTRNGRFVTKMRFSPEQAEELILHEKRTFENNTVEPLDILRAPNALEQLNVNISEGSITEPRYRLRKRQ